MDRHIIVDTISNSENRTLQPCCISDIKQTKNAVRYCLRWRPYRGMIYKKLGKKKEGKKKTYGLQQKRTINVNPYTMYNICKRKM